MLHCVVLHHMWHIMSTKLRENGHVRRNDCSKVWINFVQSDFANAREKVHGYDAYFKTA